MIHYLYRSLRDEKVKKLPAPKTGAWIFAYDLQPEELDSLVSLGFDRAILEDALDYFEVPRFEEEEGVTYFFTRYLVHRKDGQISTAPLLIAISDSYILTISHEKPELLDDYIHGRKDLITTQKVKAFLLILDALIQEYNRSLIRIRREILRFYGKIEDITEEDIKRTVGLESRISDYLSALVPTNEAFSALIRKGKSIRFHEGDIEILEDLQQDTQQVISSARNVSKTVQNIRSAHSDILAHKLNLTMKTLTAVTIIFTVPTIISGIFGMNTWLPFTHGAKGFIIIMAIIIGLSWILYEHFKRKNWI